MKKILLTALLLTFAASAFANSLKVGVLDVNKIFTSSPKVVALQNQMKTRFTPQHNRIIKLQQQLSADIQKYNKEGAVMKASDKKAMQSKITSEHDKLQDMQASFQKELLAAQKSAMQTLLRDLVGVVKGVAKEQHLNLVVTKSSLAYSDPDMDITNLVIKRFK